MSVSMDRRLRQTEDATLARRQAAAVADAQKKLGRDLRKWATNAGVPCWPPAEDARWQEWSREHGTESLYVFLDAIQEAVREIVAEDAAREGMTAHGRDV